VIEAVLFDFSGVLTTSPWAHMAALGAEAGVDGDVVLELLIGPYEEDTDHPWHRFERGEITAIDYGIDLVGRAEAAGIAIDFTKLRSLLRDLEIHEVVLDKIRVLRGIGYRTGLITNNVREASDEWRALVPIDDLFDVVVDSSAVGMRKPNPAIYRHALELLGGIASERAVFLDDSPGNVIGAQRAGLHAILVDSADPRPALAELDALLSAA